MTKTLTAPLRLESHLSARIWGGKRLGTAQSGVPIGEVWLVHEDNCIQGGPYQGYTLKALAAEFPMQLLGSDARHQRFPLLIKLLDCQEWLSVQVHPNDAQAEQLVGKGELGKTEAWYILEAAPGAEVIAGIQEHASCEQLRDAILNGRVMEYAAYQKVQAGDTVFMPAGTLHALGPGLFLYEVQQTSDTTYRVYDWDRPASAGRELHLTESAQVTTTRPAVLQHATPLAPGERRERIRCEYFVLEELSGNATPVEGDTAGESFHVLTVTKGQGKLQAGAKDFDLQTFDTWLLPAALGRYSLSGEGLQVLVARLP